MNFWLTKSKDNTIMLLPSPWIHNSEFITRSRVFSRYWGRGLAPLLGLAHFYLMLFELRPKWMSWIYHHYHHSRVSGSLFCHHALGQWPAWGIMALNRALWPIPILKKKQYGVRLQSGPPGRHISYVSFWLQDMPFV